MAGKIYIRATDAERAVLQRVMTTYHPALLQANIKVAMTMARKFDGNEQPVHCVKFAGANAAAITRTIPLRRRVYDEHDAEIEVDGLTWDELSEAQREALLDHELNHIRASVGDDNAVRLDDMGRPKVNLVPDDFTLTGFYAIGRRHGRTALEWRSVSHVHAELLRIIEEAERQPMAVNG